MQVVTNDYKTKCKSSVQSNAVGKITITDSNTEITESNDLINFTIDDNCYVNDKFIGNCICKKITVNMFNDNNEHDLEDKEISAHLGFENSNQTQELVQYGNYLIEKPDTEETSQRTQFTGYDYMIKFDVPYVDNNEYPISLDNYLSALCTQVGVEKGIFTLVNSSYMVKGNPFTNGETCRTVLSSIAQIAGGFARIGRDNKLYIVNLSSSGNPVETIDGHCYDTFTANKPFGPINKLIIKMNSGVDGEESVVSDSTSIAQNGECAITIADNPILSDEDERELVIDNIFNALNGITYVPFKMSYYGFPYLDSGDKISVSNVSDTSVTSYIFNHTIRFDGGISGNIETSALTKTQSAYKNDTILKRLFYKVELAVDKINKRITSIINEIGDRTDKTTSLTQDVETLTAQVHNVASLSNTVTGHSIELTDCANLLIHELKITGDIEKLFPRIGLFPRVGLFPRDMCLVIEKPSGTQKIRLPFNKLEYVNADDCDVFQILDGKVSITRRNGTIETYTDIFIELEEGTNTLRMENLSNANLEATYLYKNDYTENFSTKAETMAQIKLSEAQINLEVSEKVGRDEMSSAIDLATDEINLEVSEKVGRDEIISRINQSAEAIQILANKLGLTANDIIDLIAGNSINLTSKNITINSTNFNADRNGNVTCNNINCNNGTFKGNVLLGDNSSIIGTNGGLLQTITCKGEIESQSYSGASSMHPMGYSLISNDGQGTITTSKDRLKFEVLIPKNFLIKSAHIVLSAMPANFTYYDDSYQLQQISGYVRNMKLYKATSFDSGSLDVDLANFTTMQESGITYEQIANAFGSSGFTGSSYGYTEQVSIDIKSHIQTSTTENKNNMLKIETGNALVSTIPNMYSQSGGLAGTLIINGYTNFE